MAKIEKIGKEKRKLGHRENRDKTEIWNIRKRENREKRETRNRGNRENRETREIEKKRR